MGMSSLQSLIQHWAYWYQVHALCARLKGLNIVTS